MTTTKQISVEKVRQFINLFSVMEWQDQKAGRIIPGTLVAILNKSIWEPWRPYKHMELRYKKYPTETLPDESLDDQQPGNNSREHQEDPTEEPTSSRGNQDLILRKLQSFLQKALKKNLKENPQ